MATKSCLFMDLFRINTIRGWMTTWIKHAYEGVKTNCSTEECIAEVDGTISFLIDIIGYAYFSLALIPLIPAFIIKAIGNSYPDGYKFGELRAKVNKNSQKKKFPVKVMQSA